MRWDSALSCVPEGHLPAAPALRRASERQPSRDRDEGVGLPLRRLGRRAHLRRQVVIARTFKVFEVWAIIGVLYLLLILALFAMAERLERSFRWANAHRS